MPTKAKAMAWYSQSYGFSSSHVRFTLTIKKPVCWKTDAFELWCWRRLLRVPWTARRSNQSILKEINPEYSLEGLMLKLQYFAHLMWRANSLEKTLMLGKIEGRKKRGWQGRDGWMMSSTPWTWVWANSGRRWTRGNLTCCGPWGCKESNTAERLNNNLTWQRITDTYTRAEDAFCRAQLCMLTLAPWN